MAALTNRCVHLTTPGISRRCTTLSPAPYPHTVLLSAVSPAARCNHGLASPRHSFSPSHHPQSLPHHRERRRRQLAARSFSTTVTVPPVTTRTFPLHANAQSAPPFPLQTVHSSFLRRLIIGTTFAFVSIVTYEYVTDARAGIHRLTPTLLQWLYPDAEDSHEVANRVLRLLWKLGLHPREREQTRRSIGLGDGGKEGHEEGEQDLRVKVRWTISGA